MIARTDSLTLDERAALTAGTDLWHTPPVERLGIPALRLTDGPNGARGERWSSAGSAVLPCGSALGATWNRALVQRVGRVLADEARAKGAQVLLAPTVNLHRHPLGGRHFECYSEDPLLTAELAVAYIQGVQERGIAAVVKHFVCNDQEVERHTISVEVDERTLRELYLVPFEAAVRRAGVWGLMGAYNRLDGVYCCEHRWLLDDLLRDEWAFDGVVMSDWHATHSTAALADGLDLEMPGPARYLGPHAAAAVRRGALPEAAVDRAAERMLRLVERVSSDDGRHDGASVGEDAAVVAREAAAEAIVLLKNDPVGSAPLLPLPLDRLRRVALIGPLARRSAVQGGGSAEVTPTYVVSPLEALQARLGPGVELTVEEGCTLPGLLPMLDRTLLAAPLRVAYFANPDFDGEPVGHEEYVQSRTFWSGAPVPGVPAGHFAARLETVLVPDRSATWRFGLASAGQSRLLLDGHLLVDNFDPEPGETFFGRGSTQRTADIDLEAGTRHALVVEFRLDNDGQLAGLRLGAEALVPADAIERAAQAAAAADVALVIAGYDAAWESESFDRPHLDLPGKQDRLIEAVAAANPRTIVAVNAGAPVSMAWADRVPALLQLWFPGMEVGNALLDVLGGEVNPSGHLPTSFPYRLEDTPAFGHYPGTNDGVLRYAEGVFIGYRHYLTHGVEPRFCFGHGLSYTQFEYTDLEASVADDGVRLRLLVHNAGQRAGQAVIQLYVRDVDSSVARPDRELRDFVKLPLQPGEAQPVHFTLPRHAFAYWDVQRHAWHVEPGAFDLLVGASAQDIRAHTRITL